MKPMLMSSEYTAIARVRRARNHFPTIARLTTESALCPSPRVSVISTSIAAIDEARLMAMTTAPSSAAITVSTSRLPRRSISLPMPTQNSAPASVATKLICA
jgi:hypothetical protein